MKIGGILSGAGAVVFSFMMCAHAEDISENMFGLMTVDFPDVISLEPIDERVTGDAQMNEWFGAFLPEFERCAGVTSPELASLLLAASVSRVVLVAENTVAQLQESSRYQDKLADVIRRTLSGTAVLNDIAPADEAERYALLTLDALRERRIAGEDRIRGLAREVSDLWNELQMELHAGSDPAVGTVVESPFSAAFPMLQESTVSQSRPAPVEVDSYVKILPLPIPDAGDEFNQLLTCKWLGKEPRYRVIPFRAASLQNLQRTVSALRLPGRDSRLSEREYLAQCVERDADNLKAVGWALYRLALVEALLADHSELIRVVDVLNGIKPLLDARIAHAERLRQSLSEAISGKLSSYSDRGVSRDRARQAVACLNSVLKSLRASRSRLEMLTVNAVELKSWQSHAQKIATAGAKLSGLQQDVADKLQAVRSRWLSSLKRIETLN